MRIPFRIVHAEDPARATLEIQGESYPLRPGEYTPWIRLRFHGGIGVSVHGIARFLLTQTGPEVSLYVTPIQIDPESPALPISQPAYYAIYLSKLLGSFATLGMAEDTWALNEGAIDDDAFLEQAELIKQEREAMFLSALEQTRRGVVACVFDTTDRVQHMFYRHLDAGDGRVIEALYRDMDRLVGETWKHVDERHGALRALRSRLLLLPPRREPECLAATRTAIWHCSMALQESGDYFEGVDWSRTRAYTFGLGGLYLNLKGREARGIVSPARSRRAQEGADQETHQSARRGNGRDRHPQCVRRRRDLSRSVPGRGARPDRGLHRRLSHIVGSRRRQRSARACSKTTTKPGAAITASIRCWSRACCFPIARCRRQDPGIEDMAPTALELFGVQPPAWMEGKSVFRFA